MNYRALGKISYHSAILLACVTLSCRPQQAVILSPSTSLQIPPGDLQPASPQVPVPTAAPVTLAWMPVNLSVAELTVAMSNDAPLTRNPGGPVV